MDSNIIILIIIILIIFYVTTQSNSKNSIKVDNSMVLCLLMLGILVFFIYRDFNKTTESFYTKPWDSDRISYAELYRAKKGNYPSVMNNQCYRGNNKKKVRFDLVNEATIHSPIGSPHQLTQDMTSANFPTVDGQKGSPRHMFMFAKNQAHLDCCPSTYSTDKGCICTTEQQEALLQSRGRNKTGWTNPDF
jgi:hypothetical protein